MPLTRTSSLAASPPVLGNATMYTRLRVCSDISLSHTMPTIAMRIAVSTVSPTLNSRLRLTPPFRYSGWIGPSLVPSRN